MLTGGKSVREYVVNALLIADKVITEDNGKKALIGIFDTIHFPEFPAQSPPWFIFAQVANLSGHHEISFNLVREQSQEVVFSIAGEVDVQAGKGIDFAMQVGGFVFNKSGDYVLTVHIDGSPAGSRGLKVGKKEAK